MSEASSIDGEHVLPAAARVSGGRRGEGDGPSRPIPYQEQFKREMGELIESLALDDLEKRYLRSRWLDQTVWMEARAEQARKRYYVLQLLTIGGGLAIPALVSLDSVPSETRVAHWAAFSIGLAVALTTAVEGFFHFGDRWKQYRRTAELLKAEGWRFSQRSGSYQSAATHKEAFPAFADRVEQLIQKDVDVYFTEVVKTKKDENPEPATT